MKKFIWILFTFALVALSAFQSKTLPDSTIVLNDSNTVALMSEVNGTSVAKVITRLYELDAMSTNAPIYLVLYTPGGSIEDGFNLMTVAQGLRRQVNTVVVFAASMGFQITQALGTRYITHYGTLMSHKAKGGFQGEFPGQVNSRLNYWLDRMVEMDKVTVIRTKGKQTLESYTKAYANELWLTGPKSIEGGYADEIANVRCDKSIMGTFKEKVDTLFGSVIVTWSKCPLITEPVGVELPKVSLEQKQYIESILKQRLDDRKQVKGSY